MPLQATSGAASYDAFGGGVPVAINYIEDVFSTYLYTGNDGTQSIVNGIDVSPTGGLIWNKDRNNPYNHYLADTARGRAELVSNSTSAQFPTPTVGYDLVSYNTNGFTVGPANQTNINGSGRNYVTWTFRKQPKFFDVVTYTGDGTSSRGITHALTSVPGMVIIKRTDSTGGWATLNRFDNTEYRIGSPGYSTPCGLNYTAALLAGNITTYASSTVFNVGSSLWGATETFNTNGATYVAYLFAHNAGGFGLTGTDNVISCGTFDATSAGSVTLGYEPQWVLIKASNDVGSWHIQDNMRGYTTSGNNPTLDPDRSVAEFSGGYTNPTATGFTYGGLGSSFIYMAIRRGPMKTPTVGTSVFDIITRAGTAAVATVSGLTTRPDLIVSKTKNTAVSAGWYDRLRGINRDLTSSYTDAEYNESSPTNLNSVTAFNNNSYSLGADQFQGSINTSSGTNYVNWIFQRAPSFFDEVCYTGDNASSRTITHNLGVVPEMMIVKRRSGAEDWGVYTAATGNTGSLRLNTSASFNVQSVVWNNTSPTASVFTVGSNSMVNAGSSTYVAYLFATCAGVSKVGSYTGNGTTQTIDCGFTGGARFVLIKRTDSTGDWYTYDTARGMTVLTDPYLFLNTTAAETATLGSVTTVTTGFALNSTILAAINVSAASYIFLAIA